MKILENPITEAIGWTLAHSLWQASFIVLLLALVLILLNRNAAKLRYQLGIVALVAIVLSSGATFLLEYNNALNSSDIDIRTTEIANANLFTAHEAIAPITSSKEENYAAFSTRISAYFKEHLPFIVTAWALGVVLFSLRLIGSIALLQRLKRYRNYPVASKWQQRLAELSHQLGVTQKVRLLESALVNSPIVIGYFKPVVLLPIGMLSGLPAEQIEAILAHELAHIRRKDYLVNMLQHVVETLLFFHPAIWWLSSYIRHERECCCDDIAISLTQDAMPLAKALSELETFKAHRSQANLALALKGKSGNLYRRIHRIVSEKPNIPAFKESLLMVSVIVASLCFTSLQASENQKEDDQTTEAKRTLFEELPAISELPNIYLFQDTTKKMPIVFKEGVQNIAFTENGKVHHFIFNKEDELTELFIDGKAVEKKDFWRYKKEIAKAMNGIDVPQPLEATAAFPRAVGFAEVVETPSGAAFPVVVEALEAVELAEVVEASEAIEPPEIVEEVKRVKGAFTATNFQRKNGEITYSFTNDKGEYVFARLNEDYTIIDLFIEGEKASKKEREKYQPIIEKRIEQSNTINRAIGLRGTALREQERAIEMKLQAQELQMLQKEEELRAYEMKMSKERVKSLRKFEEEVIEKTLNAHELRKQEMEKVKKELEKVREEALLQENQAKEELYEEVERLRLLKKELENKKKASSLIEKELIEDGLMKAGEEFSFLINTEEMKINKKTVDKKTHGKYLKLLKKMNGVSLSEGENFVISYPVKELPSKKE